ncbi:MAG: type II toxin-antitoxin system Phd/YefM family antitoxin [Chloroflexi bacterium]|nr:type II toxin-antitoxin system Phd/YefM family antitoxin [Chloroflexota bacterium]
MVEVGVRELKQRTSEVLRRVGDNKETIAITHRGRVVARLVPVPDADRATYDVEALLAEADELAEEIGKHWQPKSMSAADAVKEQRREL